MNLKIMKLGQTVVAGAEDTIEHMDDYFVDCEETGQGINTKDSVKMMDALVEEIKSKGIGRALDFNKQLKSKTAQNMVRRALLKVHPGMDKFFS